jgi:beta-glucosidase
MTETATHKLKIKEQTGFAPGLLPDARRSQNEASEAELQTLISRLSLEERAKLTAGAGLMTTEELPAINLKQLRMADGPMGVASGRIDERDVSLLTPCGTALAASWDRELVRQVGELVADEARRREVQVLLAPNINLPRSPLFGRAFETFSEDPLLSGILAANWIAGVQSRGVAAAAKHFVGNDSETDRHSMNAVIDEKALREVYLLPFEMAVQAGAWGIMMAYNRFNGIFCAEHPVISEVVKAEWQFDGVVMSDWFGTHSTAGSAVAGLDLEMPSPARYFGPALAEAVRKGEIDESRLNDAVRRFLRLASRVGKLGDPPQIEQPLTNLADARALLRKAAAAGFVLLKNSNNLLPAVPAPGERIVLIGPNVAAPCYQGGTFAKIALSPEVETPLASFRARFGQTHKVIYEPGVPAEYRLPPLTALNVKTAPDGASSGLSVSYYSGENFEGAPVAQETRYGSTLVWFGDMPGGMSSNRPGSLRVSTVLTPETDGLYNFYFGGTGAVRLLIDGQSVGFHDPQLQAADVMGALLRGDANVISYKLSAGVAVRLDVEMSWSSGRAQGIWYGCQPPQRSGLLDRAVQAAREAKLAVLVVGETADSGVESKDRTTIALPPAQVELIERVCEANPATIVVVNAAHAVDMPWADKAGAILCVWFPGQEFGPTLVDVITGELEPGGRLPVTFASDEADYPAFNLTPDPEGNLVYKESSLIGYRSFEAEGKEPKFCFGHGLGYADFSYEGIQIQQTGDDLINVRVTLRNTATRRGKEVVQLYVEGAATEASVRPIQLKGFATINLDPGEAGSVLIPLNGRSFAHWSNQKWEVTPGTYSIKVGRSLHNIRLQSAVVIKAEDN